MMEIVRRAKRPDGKGLPKLKIYMIYFREPYLERPEKWKVGKWMLPAENKERAIEWFLTLKPQSEVMGIES
jgi:hypothetical protein